MKRSAIIGFHPQSMRLFRQWLPAGFLLLSFFLLTTAIARAQEFRAPSQKLASAVATRAGVGKTISLEVANVSSLDAAAVAEARQELEQEMRHAGMRLAQAGQSAAQVRVTLSENAQGGLWVAEISHGTRRDVVMVEAPRTTGSPSTNAPSMVIRKTLLWEQEGPVLDVAMLGRAQVLVLAADGVSLYATSSGLEPRLVQSWPITMNRAWPRDVRGRLVLKHERLFDAYLPGVRCASAQREGMNMECSESDDPWPLGTPADNLRGFFGSSRNFFTGTLSGGTGDKKITDPFYSAAMARAKDHDLWLLAGVDGRVRIFDGSSETVVLVSNWGSDLVAIQSGCGSGRQVLATRDGDWTRADALEAFEIAGRNVVSVAPAVEFAGPVTALWTAADGRSATAVSRNLQTGRYEAFTLTVACDR